VVPASALHGHLFMGQYRDAYPGVEVIFLHRTSRTLIVGDLLVFEINPTRPRSPRTPACPPSRLGYGEGQTKLTPARRALRSRVRVAAPAAIRYTNREVGMR
jgi:hypothetical protein